MKLKDYSPDNRPIERLLNSGCEKLSNSELLSIIIKTGTKENNVLALSNIILSKFNINELNNATINELLEIRGIGKIKAAQIKSIFEISKRINCFKSENLHRITKARDAYEYLKKDFLNKKQEHLIAIYLHKNNKIISKRIITIGTNNQTLVSNRDISYYAIKENARALIIAHNHPSNDCYPSFEDKQATRDLQKAIKLLEIELLDHIIVTDNNYYSFKEKGDL
jgi:DNA repair protein RadC